MPEFTISSLSGYLLIISLLAVVLTVYDKNAAVTGKWRISERTLLTVAALGGAVAMLLVMKFIRHKTLNRKFMLGLPLIIVLQFAYLALYLKKT